MADFKMCKHKILYDLKLCFSYIATLHRSDKIVKLKEHFPYCHHSLITVCSLVRNSVINTAQPGIVKIH